MYLLTILWLTIKRITHNWRITIGLIFGLVLATAIVSSIPIYSSGSLQKSFLRDWVSNDTFRPPLAIIVSHENAYRKQDVEYADISSLEKFLTNRLVRSLGRDAISSATFSRLGTNPLVPRGIAPDIRSPKADLVGASNLVELSVVIAGRWFTARDDGVVEVVVDESTFERFELLIGDTYTYWYPLQEGESPVGAQDGYVRIPIEVVGMFRAKPGFTTEQWIYPPPYSDRLFADPTVYADTLLGSYRLRTRNYDMQWVFDHTKTRVAELPKLITALENTGEEMERRVPGTSYWHSPLDFFRKWDERKQLISGFLSALAIPVIGMIAYYLMLMASIAVDHRQREIVTMTSRGGGKANITLSFLLEWIVLGAVAVTVAPFVGMFIARLMGASAGFLVFANRTSVPSHYDPLLFIYSLVVITVAIGAGMVPVFGSLKHSIVTFTHSARSRRRTAWHRYYIDFVLIGVAAFGYNSLRWESFSLSTGENVPADPVLFFVPVVGIVGATLLILRIYPFIIHIVRIATSRFPGIIWRLAIQRLARNSVEYVPLMLLLSVTISLGIYSATTARTLAVNLEDNIRYAVGADLATVEAWVDPDGFDQIVREPPFYERSEIDGVVTAARVFRARAELRRPERWSQRLNGELMAIEPYEFARTAWYRDDFGTYNFVDYLRLMLEHREGVVVATPIFLQAELEIGDELIVTYQGQEVPVYVLGHISFWPGIDPDRRPFFIVNLEHFQDYTVLEPYEVWYDLTADAPIEPIINSLAAKSVYVTEYRDAREEIFEMKREPYRMGFFGMLGLGFIASAVVTA